MKRDIKITTLDNGMMVLSDHSPHVESITVGCWFNAGARDEADDQGGAAHFLEHMAFKGTKRRTARQISEEIEQVGGFMNAYTGRERTAYHMRLLKDDLPLGIDILADILQYPTFDREEFERERGVILQEIGQSEDTPDDIIFDRFQASCYPDQAIGRPILGEAARIKSFTPADISSFMDQHYACDQMVMVAAGNIDHDQLVKLAQDHFKGLPEKAQHKTSQRRAMPVYRPAQHREQRDNEQVHLMLGYEGFGYCDDDFIAMNLFGSLFGGGMSSRLFQRIREELGLVYNISTLEMPASDSGLFAIYAGTSNEDAATLLSALMVEIDKVQTKLEPQEIERAKAQLKSGLLMSRESMSSRAEQLAHHIHTYGRIIPDAEIIERIDAITAQDLLRSAQRIFKAKPSLAAIGPIDAVPMLESLTPLAA
ncbi:MAG: M16 family metallopeptidase [Alphaproteobacteria bacterium]